MTIKDHPPDSLAPASSAAEGGVMTTYYKVMEYGECPDSENIGAGSWPIPWGPAPAKWRDAGLYLSSRNQIVEHLGPTIWEAEIDGDTRQHRGYTVVQRARLVRKINSWNRQVAQLFAADCAEHVWYITKHSAGQNAIRAARLYAFKQIKQAEIEIAEILAHRASYNFVKYSKYDVRDSQWNAAKSAASAAGSATTLKNIYKTPILADTAVFHDNLRNNSNRQEEAIEAQKAERQWQTDRLFQYLDGEVDLEAMREALEIAPPTPKEKQA